jgi:hypothetical protein
MSTRNWRAVHNAAAAADTTSLSDHNARASDSRPANFEDLRSLDQANTHLRALLEMTHHPVIPPRMSLQMPRTLERVLGPSEDNRRSKRRKLDERLIPDFKIFRYGKYGQVEPGHLRMEIVSCDGGIFSTQTSFAAENILRDDETVYCTKSNRCNIVLRHQGGTNFTLQELVIQGPASMNYSHP